MKKTKKPINNSMIKWTLGVLALLLMYSLVDMPSTNSKKLIYSDFFNRISSGEVLEVTIRGDTVQGRLQNGQFFSTLVPSISAELMDVLRKNGVRIEIAPLDSPLGNLFGAFLYFFHRFW